MEEANVLFIIVLFSLHIIYTLILLMTNDSKNNRVYLFYPKLEKRIVHESGEYYRLNMLNEWDGYTTIQDRRDDKIKKVIG